MKRYSSLCISRLCASHLHRFAKKLINLTACLTVLSGCEEVNYSQTLLPQTKEPKNEHILTRAIYSAHLQLDPHFVKVAADAGPVRDLLLGLLQYNSQGEVIPALAKEWFSDDGKNWLFILDDKATWSNGQAVTAFDFVASWQRLSDPQKGSPLTSYLVLMGVLNAKSVLAGEKAITELGVAALNPYTLQIQLEQPNYQLPKMLAHSALLPTYQGLAPQQPFISNGVYKVSLQNKQQLILEARQDDMPFKQVNYQLISSTKNPDSFDLIENPLTGYSRNEQKLPRLCHYFYEFNVQDPKLQNPDVRKAIQIMLSSAEISKGFGFSMQHILPQNWLPEWHSSFSNRSAEALLAGAGISVKNPLEITLTYDDKPQHKLIAERIMRTLSQSELFRVTLNEVEWTQLLSQREQKNFQLIRSGWCADYADFNAFLMPFHSNSPDNKMGYQNQTVDNLLTQLQMQSFDEQGRKQIAEQVLSQLEKDVVILPLFQYQRRISVDPSLGGIEKENASEVIYSKDLYRYKD